MSDFQLDTREFREALVHYAEVTGKDSVKVLNRAARNVAYRAAEFTPEAGAANIQSELFRDERLRYALTSIALKKRGVGVLKSPEFARAVERFVSQRIASNKYLRSGWAEALSKLGADFHGERFKGASGDAIKATIDSLVAEIVAITNHANEEQAEGAERIGYRALQEAIDFVALDMESYANDLMARNAEAHSA